jgi:hypothetical protein
LWFVVRECGEKRMGNNGGMSRCGGEVLQSKSEKRVRIRLSD